MTRPHSPSPPDDTHDEPTPRRFSWRFRLVALTIVVTSMLIGVEIVLRILGIQMGGIIAMSDPHTGSTHIPNRTLVHDSEGFAVVRINSHGFRDHETTREKPPGTFRIALLGDSFVEARQVALEHAVSEQLESLLKPGGRYEVLNFGMNGFSTAQERLRLEHFALPFDPDLVVLCVTFTNDIRDNHADLSSSARPYYTLADGQLTLDTSFRDQKGWMSRLRAGDSRSWRIASWIASNVRLAGVAVEALRSLTQRKRHNPPTGEMAEYYTGSKRDLNIYDKDPPEEWSDAWAVTEALFIDIKRLCDERDIPFVAVIQASSQQIDSAARAHFAAHAPPLDLDHPERRLSAFFSANHIAHVALGSPFRAYREKTGQYLHGFGQHLGFGHWNEKGHELAAQTISQFLVEQNLLEKHSVSTD